MRSNKTAGGLKLNTFVSANIYIFTKRSEMFTLQKWKSFICATKIVIFSWCGPVYGTCVRRGKFGKNTSTAKSWMFFYFDIYRMLRVTSLGAHVNHTRERTTWVKLCRKQVCILSLLTECGHSLTKLCRTWNDFFSHFTFYRTKTSQTSRLPRKK